MMLEDFDESFRISHLPPYQLGSLAQEVMSARSQGRDIIDLSQLNPDYPPNSLVIDKLVQAVLLPQNHKYSSSQGIAKLRQAIVDFYQRKYQVDLDSTKEAIVTLGTKEGLAHLLLAVCSAEDSVILPTPSYPVHAAAIFIAGARAIGLPLFSTDPDQQQLSGESEDFFQRLTNIHNNTWPRPRLMIVSFPHNPTTATVTISFFDRLVEFARKNQMYLVHDFAYSELCYDGYQAPSILQVKGAKDVAVEFISLSKGFSMPGWRMGFCVGNTKLVAALRKIKSYLDFGVFQPLQIAAVTALGKSSEITDEVSSVYKSRRDVLVQGLNDLGWEVKTPQATLFVWSKLPPEYAQSSQEFSIRLLREHNLAICPGAGFAADADSYVRFALSENESRLRLALKQLAQAKLG